MKRSTSLFFLFFLLFSCAQNNESKEILFVCTHGAARSPIAAAYFNKIAEEKDLNYHAVFRGTKPDKKLSGATILGLTNDNFDVKEWKPEAVSQNDIGRAYEIVTFDCVLPSDNIRSMVIEWNGTPSISKDYDIARSAIRQRVEKFIDKLPK